MHAPDPSLSALDADPERLLARYRETGDPRLFGAFFDATSAELHRIAVSLLPDPVGADDAVQETYLTALQVMERFDGARRVMPWLVGILRNVVLHARRSRRRHRTTELLPGDEKPGPPEAMSPEGEGGAEARAAMDVLEEPYRSAALLRWRYGLEPAEIAHVRGEPPGTTRSILARAVERMRKGWKTVPAVFLGRTGGAGGLEAVRAVVVKQAGLSAGVAATAGAAASAASGGAGMVIGGGLLVKKAIVAAVAAVLLLSGAWVFWPHRAPIDERGPTDAPTLATVAKPVEPAASGAPPLAGKPGARSVPAPALVAGAGLPIRGRVVDRAGQGIGGARVVSIPDDLSTTFRLEELGKEGAPAFTVRCDGEGRFEVPTGATAPFHVLVAEADGYGARTVPSLLPGADVVVTLAPPAVLAGTVADVDGHPVAGARVRFLGVLHAYAVTREVRTDASGAYRIATLPSQGEGVAGPFSYFSECEVTAEGYAPLFTRGPIAPPPTAEQRQDFVLLRGASLTGTILDAETEMPIEGATVVLWSVQGQHLFGQPNGSSIVSPYGPHRLTETVSGADGGFRFEHVPAEGSEHVSTGYGDEKTGRAALGGVGAWKDGYAAATDRVLVMKDGAAGETTLRLWPSAIVAGRVVDAEGRPVAGAVVTFQVDGRTLAQPFPERLYPEHAPSLRYRTEADGVFRLPNVPATKGSSTTVRVLAWGKRVPAQPWPPEGDASATVSVPAGETMTLPDLVLSAPAQPPTTVFTVTTADGRPVWGALVSRPGGYTLRTDAQGQAFMRWTPPAAGSPWPAQVFYVRYPGLAVRVVTFTPTGKVDDLVKVTMEPGHELRGRVLEADGRPASGATVEVGDGSRPVEEIFPDPSEGPTGFLQGPRAKDAFSSATSDANGEFRIPDLPRGLFHVQASRFVATATGGRTLRSLASGIRADVSGLELRLPVDDSPRLGRVTGQVLDAATGKPVPDLTILLRRGEEIGAYALGNSSRFLVGSGARGDLEATGAFQLEGVAAGTWTLAAFAPGYVTATVEGVAVSEGAPTALPTLRLGTGATVVGRLRAAGDVMPPGRQLTFSRVSGPGGSLLDAVRATVDGNGAFRATGFAAGTWEVTLQVEGSREPWTGTYIPEGRRTLIVPEGAGEVRYEATLVLAGVLAIQPDDPRLPAARWDVEVNNAKPATPERTAFGAASRVIVKGPDGAVLLDQTGLRQHDSGPRGYLALLPGRYTARLELPGGDVREETADVVAGARVVLRFPKK